MLTEKFLKALPILEQIENHQQEAYFVGGCVRDLLLQRPIKDIDITTSASPDIIQQIFPSVIPVGIEHGTVIVRHEHESYEVTTFRTEGKYSDGRHPDRVEFIQSIEKDLERRDFTINALAMDKNGEIIDLFGGRKDLEKKIIRTVGEGKERFGEDALRIIRALRFSSQLDFRIEDSTYEAMVQCKSAILDLSVERITSEMEKFFAGSYVNNGMKYLQMTNLTEVLPVFKEEPDLIERFPEIAEPLDNFSEVIALFHYLKPDVSIQRWAKEWKCSNRTKRLAIQLTEDISHYEKYGIDKMLLYQMDVERFQPFIRLVDIIFKETVNLADLQRRKSILPLQSRNDLAIDGNDLTAMFPDKERGPWIKEMLEKVEAAIIRGRLRNQYDEIKEWLKWDQQETN